MNMRYLKSRLVIGASALAAGSFAFAAPAAAATAFQNGSFFLGTATSPLGDSFQTVCAGSTSGATDATAITGWTVTGGSVDVVGTGYWTPEVSGTNSLDMNGSPLNCPTNTSGASLAAGTIQQTFTTVPGGIYFVSFWMAGNPAVGYQGSTGEAVPATKTLYVQATGGSKQTYTFTNNNSTSATNMGWVQKGYTFSANSDSTTLSFMADSNNTSYGGPALDSVTVTPIITSGAQCKDGGWKNLFDPNTGANFKNQGQCVSHFATSGDVPIGS